MKTTILLFILSTSLVAQEVTINPDLFVSETKFEIVNEGVSFECFDTFDNKKEDHLNVYIGQIGPNKYSLKIDFENEIECSINSWSGRSMFDETNQFTIELESFELHLNNENPKIGDTLMGKFEGVSKTIYLVSGGTYKMELRGEFRHIIGKRITKRTARGNFRISN